MATAASADRNLLFGVLALQLDFLTRDALVAGMNAWAVDKGKPLGRILVGQGALSAARLELLDALVVEHLNRHGGDASVSLAAAANGSTLSEALDAVADPEVRSTLSALAGALRPIPPAVRDSVRFRNLRPHAKGGLGQVFVADDLELNREVALKEIQPHRADDPASRARFVREAEITGALEHPGVIPVYGLGTHPDGRPYYAMRFVRGETLKAAIERYHGLPAADRPVELRRLLGRLVHVCNAIAYAHSRGVVHRDLKPANVLLGPFGETLVVDWGLAKAGLGRHPADDATTDPTVHPSSESGEPTRVGSAIGTPGYMSPEQAAGDPNVGPATDVFGLGAILYSILTGRKPFEGTTVEDEVARTRKGVFPPPREINRDVPPALDAVCTKALARDPADRYRTPLDLATDLERWLADEPVGVHRDPWPVRAGRWAKRHRTPVATAAALLVTAAVGLGFGTALLWREERKTAEKKREAEENYQLARDLSGGGIDLLAANEAEFVADPAKHAAWKDLMVAAARAYHKHLEHQRDDPEVRRLAARVFRYAANLHRLEWEFVAAESLYRDAVALIDRLVAEFPDDPAYRLQLAETLRDQAKAHSALGRLAEARGLLQRSLDLADGLLATDQGNSGYRRARAATLLNRATVELTCGDLAAAGADAAQAADLFAALAAEAGAAHPYDALLRGAALNVRAIVERESGRRDKAGPLHGEAIGLLIDLAKEDRAGLNRNDALDARSALILEQCQTIKGNPKVRARVENNLGAVVKQWELLAANCPRIARYREMAGLAYYERGVLRAEDGRAADARADLEKAKDTFAAEARRAPDVPELAAALGRTYAALARLARVDGDAAAARDGFDRAVAALRSAADRAPDDAQVRRDLAAVTAEREK